MKKSLLFSLIFFSAAGLFSQNADSFFIKRIADEILTNGQAYENLRHLSKQIGPSLAGSQGMVKAEHWGLRLMLESGADKAWRQECMVPHWVRGGKDEMWSSQLVSANIPGKPDARLIKRYYDVVALGNSAGTPKAGLSAEVLLVNSFDELDKRKEEAKGKIVFFNYKFNPTFIRTFQSYGDAAKYRGNGPSAAAKYGAAGVIIRSMSHSVDNHPHTGATRYDSAYAKIPAVAVGLRDADFISDQLKKGKLSVTIKTNGYFLPDTIGHNIIGELKGTEFPEEIVTVGGHLDSWDNCEGAHDDGAGCVQAIEILRTFKVLGYKPKRTIRFVLFANEENGLRGGLKYAEEAKFKNEKHVLAIESDAGGFTPRGLGFSGSDEQFKKFMMWRELIAPYGCSEFYRGGGGADIGPLNRALGTPMAALHPDSQRYFDVHHARSDVFEAVNKRELELGAINMAALIYLVDKYGL
ncbi:MAG: M20/M25/M40 family metallo-hydrolase [Chitinophagaceae bacterium]|nr:M20/M25/M40 family metallo-hydrolase [Chitinophagaceae bacterium]